MFTNLEAKLPLLLALLLLAGSTATAQDGGFGGRSIPRGDGDHGFISCETRNADGAGSPLLGLTSGNPWPSGIVYYNFDAAVSSANRTRMLNAMAVISATVNVTFAVRTNQAGYITIRNSSVVNVNSSSAIGRTGARQFIDIYNWTNQGIVIHEIFHALGLRHEQCRADRDDYVSINVDKIDPTYLYNFDLQPGVVSGTYDFLSLMHYSPYSFSLDSDRVIDAKGPYGIYWQYAMGYQTTISAGDAAALRAIYGGTTRPDYFQLKTPSHGEFTGNTEPTLSWTASNGAVDYRVQIGTDTFAVNVIHDAVVTGTSYSVPPGVLQPNHEYYWRVYARNTKGQTGPMPIPAYVFSTRSSNPLTVYVDPGAPAGGDGASWNSAFNSILDAETIGFVASLSDPDGPGVEMRVAGGTYRADSGFNNRNAYIPLDGNVRLKGGYAGRGAADPDARDFVAHESIITGDLLGNDTADPSTRDDNSLWLVICSFPVRPSVLDGFTLKGASNENQIGGAVLADSGGLIVRNCRIESNRAGYYGTGLTAIFGADLTVEDSTIASNTTLNTPTTFNTGGTTVRFRSSATFDRVRFLNNSGTTGSALSVYDSKVEIFNSLFAGNVATGMTNGAATEGGTIAVRHFFPATTDLKLVNVTLASNAAPASTTGALFAAPGSGSLRDVKNSILWGNMPSTPIGDWTVASSLIQGGWPGAAILDADPLFMNAGAGDYSVQLPSLAIDTASSGALSPAHAFDLDGNARMIGAAPDMGAFEHAANTCPADINYNGLVDDSDFVQFAAAYDLLDCSDPNMPLRCPADLTLDGFVDDTDFVMFATAYDALLCS